MSGAPRPQPTTIPVIKGGRMVTIQEESHPPGDRCTLDKGIKARQAPLEPNKFARFSLPYHERPASRSHTEPFPEIHLKAGPAHLVKVKRVKCFRLAHGEDIAPTPSSPLSKVVNIILSVRLRTALHSRDGGRSNHLHKNVTQKKQLHKHFGQNWLVVSNRV